MHKKAYYAVRRGRQSGIYPSWDACKAQVAGYSGAEFKGFATLEEANQYLQGGDSAAAEDAVLQDPDVVTAYVDGSYRKEQNRFSYAAILFFRGEELHRTGSDTDPELAEMHNVAGEIRAAEEAMRFALEHGAHTLHLYHDYAGIACWCTGAWKAGKPGTLRYRQFYQRAMQNGLTVHFHKVEGHSGNRYNELADRLAREALEID